MVKYKEITIKQKIASKMQVQGGREMVKKLINIFASDELDISDKELKWQEKTLKQVLCIGIAIVLLLLVTLLVILFLGNA